MLQLLLIQRMIIIVLVCILIGTAAYTHIHGCHYNSEVWEDPYKFDPGRFTPENSRGRPSHAYVAFAAGPRLVLRGLVKSSSPS